MKPIVIIALAVLLMTCFFPPWQYTSDRNGNGGFHTRQPAGYGFILSPPAKRVGDYNDEDYGIQMDVSRLLIEWVIIIVGASIIILSKRQCAKIFILAAACLIQTSRAQNYDTNNVAVQSFVGSGFFGLFDGNGEFTMFNNPLDVATDSGSNIFILDSANFLIRKATLAGDVTSYSPLVSSPATFGSIAVDHETNVYYTANVSGEYRVYTLTLFPPLTACPGNYSTNAPGDICFDSQNRLYFSDPVGNRIFRYSGGTNDIFAGSGNAGALDGFWVFTSFNTPTAITCDSADNIYVWDSGNRVIRKIDSARNVTTIAGNKILSGDSDGIGLGAAFRTINAMSADSQGNIFLACNTSVRKMDGGRKVTTLAGSFSQFGYVNGAGQSTRFSGVHGLCLNGGNIYVTDVTNQRVRQITFNPSPQVTAPSLGISTYAGVTIIGIPGRSYQIQSSASTVSWNTETTLALPSSPFLWIDPNPVGSKKFYRAVLLP